MKISFTLVIFLFLVCTLIGQYQNEWVKQIGGESSDLGLSVFHDNSGNIFLAGRFQGTVDLDPGNGVHMHTSLAEYDSFFLKLDAEGNTQWIKQIKGEGNVRIRTIKTDLSGNIYTTGFYDDWVDFDPSGSEYWLNTNGESDIFVQKFDPLGQHIWTQVNGGEGSDVASDLEIDEVGNVYCSGHFEETVEFGGQGYSTNTQTDSYIHKMDTEGNTLWFYHIPTIGISRAVQIALDQQGNLYSTGYFQVSADFDLMEEFGELSSAGSTDGYVIKIDSEGNYQWVNLVGGANADAGFAICTDPSGNVGVAGYFDGPIDLDPSDNEYVLTPIGERDVFIVKFNSSGIFQWANQLNITESGFPTNMESDDASNLYVVGDFEGAMDFDSESELYNFTSFGDIDGFLYKCDSDGNFSWAHQIGSPGLDRIWSLDVGADSDLFVTGLFSATVDFEPGSDEFNLSAEGESDLFFQRLSFTPVAVSQQLHELGIIIYPNPSNGDFVIMFKSELTDVTVKILDSKGRTIQEYKYLDASEIHMEIDQTQGLYFLQITSSIGSSTHRVIIN